MRRTALVLAAVVMAGLSFGCHDVHVQHHRPHRTVYRDVRQVDRQHHRPTYSAPVHVARPRHGERHADAAPRVHHGREGHRPARVREDVAVRPSHGDRSGTRVRTRAGTDGVDVRVRVDD